MENIFLLLYQLCNNNHFLLLVDSLSFTLKISIFLYLSVKAYMQHKKKLPVFFLLVTLLSGSFIDCGWILKLIYKIGDPVIANQYLVFMSRAGWAFFVLQYQSIILLFDSLTSKDHKTIFKKNAAFILCSFLFILFFIIFSFYAYNLTTKLTKPAIEPLMIHFCSIYLLLILMPVNLWRIFSSLRMQKIPIIIKQQCYTLLSYLVIPYLLSDLVNMSPIKTDFTTTYIQSQAFTGISTLILTYLLYFCIRRILNIRFLNFKPDIKAVSPETNSYFKDSSTILSMVNHTYELAPIVEQFLHKALRVQEKKMHLFVRTSQNSTDMNTEPYTQKQKPMHPVMTTIETALLGSSGKPLLAYLKKEQIVLFDELDFANFYDQDPFLHSVLELLQAIDCCVLVPLFEKNDLVGYIVILNHVQKEILYSSADKDMLVVFGNHLGTIIGSMQYKRMQFLTEQNSELLNDAYFKNQYMSHVKESIRSFMPHQQDTKIAIFSYKNNQFLLCNSGDLSHLLPADLNTQQGHPITKQCKALVHLALKEKSIQTTLLNVDKDRLLRAIAVPDKESNQLFLLMTAPVVSDLVADHLATDHLVDVQLMHDWDYILYLHTTQTGTLIHTLLPGWSKTILLYKIDLLKSILSKKALFIDCQPTDIPMLVNTIHKAIGRKNMSTLDILTHPNYEAELFGMSCLYEDAADPLLQTMHLESLFIDNIHQMSLHAQEKLATYIRYGHFTKLESSTLILSDVQILLGTSAQDTENSNDHSDELCTILENQRVTIPTPADLDEKALVELIEGYSAQAMEKQGPGHLFSLSDREKKALVTHKPSSLTQLKLKVNALIAAKNKGVGPEVIEKVDPTLLFTDQALVQAARLGKNALKDQRTMLLLWHKFNKNQHKIATFLGVNRSSVGRRMKVYNFT